MRVHGQVLALSALLVAIAGLLLGPRPAAWQALASALRISGVYQAEMHGPIGGLSTAAHSPPVNRVYTLLVLLLVLVLVLVLLVLLVLLAVGLAAAVVFARAAPCRGNACGGGAAPARLRAPAGAPVPRQPGRRDAGDDVRQPHPANERAHVGAGRHSGA